KAVIRATADKCDAASVRRPVRRGVRTACDEKLTGFRIGFGKRGFPKLIAFRENDLLPGRRGDGIGAFAQDTDIAGRPIYSFDLLLFTGSITSRIWNFAAAVAVAASNKNDPVTVGAEREIGQLLPIVLVKSRQLPRLVLRPLGDPDVPL